MEYQVASRYVIALESKEVVGIVRTSNIASVDVERHYVEMVRVIPSLILFAVFQGSVVNAGTDGLTSEQKALVSALPTGKPVAGRYQTGFGIRVEFGKKRMHEGLDILAKPGTKVRATAPGTVISVSSEGLKGNPELQNVVMIDHGQGLKTCYGNLGKILVKRGAKLERGDSIGYSTEKHLHYEIRVHDVPVDPLSYILEE